MKMKSAFRSVRFVILGIFSVVIMCPSVKANPASNTMNEAGQFLEDKCNDIVANQIAESLTKNRYETSNEEAIRDAEAYKSAYEQSQQRGGGFLGIKVNTGNSRSSNNEGSSEYTRNLKKSMLLHGLSQGKTVNPVAVGKDCTDVANAYNAISVSFLQHATAIYLSDNETTVALGQQDVNRSELEVQLQIALGEQDIEGFALETERQALEMQHKLLKQQMRQQRLDKILAPFTSMLQAMYQPTQPTYNPYQPPMQQQRMQPQIPGVSPEALQRLLQSIQ